MFWSKYPLEIHCTWSEDVHKAAEAVKCGGLHSDLEWQLQIYRGVETIPLCVTLCEVAGIEVGHWSLS